MDSGWPLSYARVSMDGQHFTARTDALIAVGVATDRVIPQKGHGEYSVRSAGVRLGARGAPAWGRASRDEARSSRAVIA